MLAKVLVQNLMAILPLIEFEVRTLLLCAGVATGSDAFLRRVVREHLVAGLGTLFVCCGHLRVGGIPLLRYRLLRCALPLASLEAANLDIHGEVKRAHLGELLGCKLFDQSLKMEIWLLVVLNLQHHDF